MFLATSRGVPEAGLTFALAMVVGVGVGVVLVAVAVASVWARERVLSLVTRQWGRLDEVVRLVEGIAGLSLLLLAAAAFL